jgi:hypothetical protein
MSSRIMLQGRIAEMELLLLGDEEKKEGERGS